jgi:hypothetical protein
VVALRSDGVWSVVVWLLALALVVVMCGVFVGVCGVFFVPGHLPPFFSA